jgi:hypothetical protein
LSKFKIFSTRVFEQFCGNTTAKLLNEGKIDITLFDKAKVHLQWRKTQTLKHEGTKKAKEEEENFYKTRHGLEKLVVFHTLHHSFI